MTDRPTLETVTTRIKESRISGFQGATVRRVLRLGLFATAAGVGLFGGAEGYNNAEGFQALPFLLTMAAVTLPPLVSGSMQEGAKNLFAKLPETAQQDLKDIFKGVMKKDPLEQATGTKLPIGPSFGKVRTLALVGLAGLAAATVAGNGAFAGVTLCLVGALGSLGRVIQKSITSDPEKFAKKIVAAGPEKAQRFMDETAHLVPGYQPPEPPAEPEATTQADQADAAEPEAEAEPEETKSAKPEVKTQQRLNTSFDSFMQNVRTQVGDELQQLKSSPEARAKFLAKLKPPKSGGSNLGR